MRALQPRLTIISRALPSENREHGQVLVGAKEVVSAGGDERRMAFAKLELFSTDLERASPFENDVELVVVVDALAVGLRGDERVDADLEPGRFMNELVTSVSGAQACLGFRDVKRVRPIQCLARRAVRRRSHWLSLLVVGSSAALTPSPVVPGSEMSARIDSSAW
jgi:hypothetical protein